jgi:hypothetical protein
VTVLSDTASARGLETVLSAYSALGEGDAAPVLELLAPDVEWWSQGVRLYRGREATARAFARARQVEVTGIRKGANVVVFEFAALVETSPGRGRRRRVPRPARRPGGVAARRQDPQDRDARPRRPGPGRGVTGPEQHPRRPDPKELSDEELERELTLAVAGQDTERLEWYERLLREKAERRARRVGEG